MVRLGLILAALAASGCYSPELQDCTVTCGGSDECAGDQVCNHGRCVAEGVSCTGATPDAGTGLITLRVQVGGTGRVIIAGIGECDDSECMWQVPVGTIRVDAQRIDSDKPFEHWTTPNCGGAQAMLPTCTFTPTASTTVGAKFK